MGAIGGFLQNHKPELRDRARQAGEEIRLRMALGSLDLSEEQRAKLKELEDRTQQERREIMAEVKPRLDAIRDSVKQTLESTLTDEQKSQLAKRLGDKPRPGGEHPLRQRRDAPE